MSKNKAIFLLLAIIIIHAFVLTKLIFFPYPELFIYPYLTNNGLKPYSQILDQHFPGLMFLPVNFDNLGMTNEVIAREWLIGIIVITHLLLFLISRHILKSNLKALLVNLLYFVWQPFFEGWVLWIDNFLPLFLLSAFYFFLKEKYFLAGVFLGLGVVFKQTIIPLSILILLYIVWSERKLNKAAFLFGLTIPLLLMIVYLISIGVLKDFWYWTIVFNLTIYSQSGTQMPDSIGFISRVIMVYGSSAFALLHKDRKLKILLFLFLFGSMIGVIDRSNFVHFQPSLPFVVIATAVGVYSLSKKNISLIVMGLYLTITIWWQNIFYKGHLSNKIFFFDQETKQLAEKIKLYTVPGEKIFVFGAPPHLYQMSSTIPAGDVFVFQFPWFLKVAGNSVLEGIKKDKPEIIVSDRSSEIEGQRLIEYAKEIDNYIQQNYQKIDNVGSAAILKKKS